MPLYFGGTGVTPDLQGQSTNVIALAPGECYELPNNWFQVRTGKYTTIQEYDPIIAAYRTPGGGFTGGGVTYTKGDGNNYRLANQTGCIVGGHITNAGTGYTSAPVVTASAGGSLWRAIVGGALNTSVTVTNGGSGYTYPPTVLIAAPPPGGIQASAIAVLTAGAVSSVTVLDQGAGYASAPTITFLNDPREGLNGISTGANAAATSVLTGSGTITGLICIDHGNTLGSVTALPTLAFSGGGGASAAATAIMCWSIIAYTVSATTTGSGYAAPVVIQAYGGYPSASPAYTNVTTQSQLLKGRNAQIIGAVSGTAVTATGQVVNDGGIYPGIPTVYAFGFIQGAGAVQAVFTTPTLGGQNDISILLTT